MLSKKLGLWSDPTLTQDGHTPMLLMPGNDTAHPAVVSDEVLRLAPDIEYLKLWKGEGRDYSALVTRDFLLRNTPA